MHRPEARRVSGHRRAQLHESGRTRRTRYRSSPDQRLWRHRGGRMRHRADVGGGARHRRDGPRDARRQLAARGRHAADQQDAGPDRLRRHRRGSRAHRARQRHAGDRLEPVAEALFRRRFRQHRHAAGAERRGVAASVAERRDPRLSYRKTHRGDEAGCDPRQYRTRRDGRRSRDDRGFEVRSHPACRARRPAAGPARPTGRRRSPGPVRARQSAAAASGRVGAAPCWPKRPRRQSRWQPRR